MPRWHAIRVLLVFHVTLMPVAHHISPVSVQMYVQHSIHLQGALTAALIDNVSDIIRSRLKDHPVNQRRAAAGKNIANVILLRGCGMRLRLPSFEQRHGLRSCIVAPTKILGGKALLNLLYKHVT